MLPKSVIWNIIAVTDKTLANLVQCGFSSLWDNSLNCLWRREFHYEKSWKIPRKECNLIHCSNRHSLGYIVMEPFYDAAEFYVMNGKIHAYKRFEWTVGDCWFSRKNENWLFLSESLRKPPRPLNLLFPPVSFVLLGHTLSSCLHFSTWCRLHRPEKEAFFPSSKKCNPIDFSRRWTNWSRKS